jgi:hypothetical protein
LTKYTSFAVISAPLIPFQKNQTFPSFLLVMKLFLAAMAAFSWTPPAPILPINSTKALMTWRQAKYSMDGEDSEATD